MAPIKLNTPEELGKYLTEQADRIDGLVKQVGELETTNGQLVEQAKVNRQTLKAGLMGGAGKGGDPAALAKGG